MDPCTLQRVELPAFKFFRSPLSVLFTSKDLIEFEVLDVELLDGQGTDRDAATAAPQGQQVGRRGTLGGLREQKPDTANRNMRSKVEKWQCLSGDGHVLRCAEVAPGRGRGGEKQ